MNIAGVISLNRFPLWERTFRQLLTLCDKVYIRFDSANGDPSILQEAIEIGRGKIGNVAMVPGWTVPQWREDMLNLVRGEPEDTIVLTPDEDEVFDDGLADELKAFYYSDKGGMMFNYNPLSTVDGRIVNDGMPYPPEAHMKAFRLRHDLSYFPYHGNGMVAQYCNPDTHWRARTKINHLCCWTKKMEQAKHWRSHTPHFKGVKKVTLLGFGPTSVQLPKGGTEIWSVNNCYDVFMPPVMNRITRIFEMHTFGPRTTPFWQENARFLEKTEMDNRDRMVGLKGERHVDVLSECGRAGRRIIMQQKHPEIFNSEPLDVNAIVKKTGVDWFLGTPCYMIAQAIVEGYTHVDCYGIDQMDWEHCIQRDCFAGWVMYAIGRGMKLGGSQTWLDRYRKYGLKRYGYDFGPEWCEWCEKTLWQGFPISVRFKGESRIVQGDLYKPGGK